MKNHLPALDNPGPLDGDKSEVLTSEILTWLDVLLNRGSEATTYSRELVRAYLLPLALRAGARAAATGESLPPLADLFRAVQGAPDSPPLEGDFVPLMGITNPADIAKLDPKRRCDCTWCDPAGTLVTCIADKPSHDSNGILLTEAEREQYRSKGRSAICGACGTQLTEGEVYFYCGQCQVTKYPVKTDSGIDLVGPSVEISFDRADLGIAGFWKTQARFRGVDLSDKPDKTVFASFDSGKLEQVLTVDAPPTVSSFDAVREQLERTREMENRLSKVGKVGRISREVEDLFLASVSKRFGRRAFRVEEVTSEPQKGRRLLVQLQRKGLAEMLEDSSAVEREAWRLV